MQTNNTNFLKGKKVIVVGLGKSGISVIRKLSMIAGEVIAIDNNPLLEVEPHLGFVEGIKDFRLNLILDEKVNKNTKILDGAALVILSPGVSTNVSIISGAEERNIPVWSELEFGWQLLSEAQKKNTVAVTGTNGKTTVVSLIQKVFNDCGLESIVCGNIGNPLTDTIDAEGIPGWKDCSEKLIRIIEVSSFQLEKIKGFKPFASIILNITSDHIDRHFSMERYADLKFKIFLNASAGDWSILNIDDEYIKEGLNKRNNFRDIGQNILKYSLCDDPDAQVILRNGKILYDINAVQGSIDISRIRLIGPHNISNIMSVIGAAKIYGLRDREIENSLNQFSPLEHRIEFVAEIKGVKIYNDSKATNPDATIKALESFGRQVTLILGGKDKDMDFTVLLPVLEAKVLNLILIGETKQKILNILTAGHQNVQNVEKTAGGKTAGKKTAGGKTAGGKTAEEKLRYNVVVCDTLREAVDKGLEMTESGNIFLFSPACASFD
ncbi:MAG TPA: UDP-N-acetylmuramoyl-L-alanine--D-glutamate ligase, partial [Candidatus Humimicrobiaceae bacterium]